MRKNNNNGLKSKERKKHEMFTLVRVCMSYENKRSLYVPEREREREGVLRREKGEQM